MRYIVSGNVIQYDVPGVARALSSIQYQHSIPSYTSVVYNGKQTEPQQQQSNKDHADTKKPKQTIKKYNVSSLQISMPCSRCCIKSVRSFRHF